MAFRRPSVRLAQQMPRSRRKLRSPRHTFRLRYRPFVIQPFMIAPVLPGETMTNLILQSTANVFALQDFMTGWWHEYYLFYIKHRDLDDRDEFVEMMLNPSWSKANVDAPADDINVYTTEGGINFVQLCLNRVVDEYFRDEDEDHTNGLLDGMPMAHVDMPGWMDSLLMTSDYASEDITLVNEAGSGTLTASELQASMQQWELLRMGNLTNQTYEEFLATYGVKLPQVELHRPELIRYVRDWKYPALTIDSRITTADGAQTAGQPIAGVQWKMAERADKDRYFSEPGFIFGVTVTRPKTMFAAQTGAMANWLDSVKMWIPAVLADDPTTSIRAFTDAAAGGPFKAALSEAYVADMKDLYMHGDQFINFDLADLKATLMSLPDASGQRRYVSDGDLDALFRTPQAGDVFDGVYVDGVVSLNIKTSLEDTSDTSSGSVA